MELKELLSKSGTAPFSRLKYIPRLGSDEQLAEFVNALYVAAAEAKYEDDWDKLSDFLEHWEEVGIGLQFAGLRIPDLEGVPWATLTRPLDRARVALVTTGGVFLEGQTPYSERGDATYREIPKDAAHDGFRIWHPGYDFGPAMQDINCIFPLDRFKELRTKGSSVSWRIPTTPSWAISSGPTCCPPRRRRIWHGGSRPTGWMPCC